MPLSLDSLLAQPSNKGSFDGASGNATLPTPTTAGNTVIIVASTSQSDAGSITTPTGFVADPTAGANTWLYVFRRSNVPGGETSWLLDPGGTGLCIWVAYEVQGLDPVAPVDVKFSPVSNTTTGTSLSTGTTAISTTYDGLVLVVHGVQATGTTAPTLTGHTGGVTVLDTHSGGGVDPGDYSLALSVAAATTQQLATWESTATSSTTMTSTRSGHAHVLVYSATGAKRAPDIAFFWGFKVGAGAVGLGTGNAGSRYIETVTGSPAITADGLQCSATAAAEMVTSASITLAPAPAMRANVVRVKLRFDGALPAGDLDLFTVDPTGADAVVVRYRTATGKLGVQITANAEQLSVAPVVADTWYGIDLRVLGETTAWTCDWQVDGIDQTQATGTAGSSLPSFTLQLGWSSAQTGAVTFAHALCSVIAGHYPLGDHTVVLLKADPAGTLTISGTSTNFALMTANATGAAWNAATALTNITEGPPPTIGASAAGFCQTATAASDYVEVPMETYQAAPLGSVRAVRMLACGWAASTTAATIGFRGWNGTAATTLLAAADPAFDNSTSDPAWVCKLYKPTGGWTQAQLDALAFRVGFSDDATPDIGIHWIGAEVAVQATTSGEMIGEAGEVTTTGTFDSLSSGVSGLTTTTPPHRPVTLHYTKDGTPTSVVIPADTVDVRVLDAADIAGVTDIGVENEAS